MPGRIPARHPPAPVQDPAVGGKKLATCVRWPSTSPRASTGAFIIDPKDAREKADEMVMVMNGFDTNFDRANEIYAANTIGFAYSEKPIKVKRDELVRLYLVNVLEYDLINSFHLHGNFFQFFPTGTSKQPSEGSPTR